MRKQEQYLDLNLLLSLLLISAIFIIYILWVLICIDLIIIYLSPSVSQNDTQYVYQRGYPSNHLLRRYICKIMGVLTLHNISCKFLFVYSISEQTAKHYIQISNICIQLHRVFPHHTNHDFHYILHPFMNSLNKYNLLLFS